jgi:UDP-glucose 4-epimerase
MACILLTGCLRLHCLAHMVGTARSAGFDVVGIDNFVNSSPRVLDRMETIGGFQPEFIQGDVRDAAALDRCFELGAQFGGISAVVHFAALKAVGESVERRLDYFENNLGGLLSVCQAMKRHGVHNVVFSSSATVYGKPERLAHHRRCPASCDQSLWSDQADGRRNAARVGAL